MPARAASSRGLYTIAPGVCISPSYSAAVSSRSVVETALRFNAAHVVLAHNHPNGVALPSEEDLHTTDRLYNALAGVTVHLVDHIIVADNDYVSMADSGYFSMNASYYP